MTYEKCSNCYCWVPRPLTDKFGTCRRKSPVIVTDRGEAAVWPETLHSDWCYEHVAMTNYDSEGKPCDTQTEL